MIEKEKFSSVGGFSEDLAVGFNDVDLCLKLLSKDLFNVFVPHVELLHDESTSRGSDDFDEQKRERNNRENAYMKEAWGPYIDNDPFYNPNLSRLTPFCNLKM